MGHPRLITYAFMLVLLVLLAVPGIAAAGPVSPPVALDDTQSYYSEDILPQMPQAGAQFGYSVATDGRTVVIGARYETVDGKANAGAVYVYYFWDYGHYEPELMARITAPEPQANARFGQSVAFNDGTIVVGAPYDATKGASAGAAYVYAGSEDRWNLEATLYASDAQQYDRFGDAVACNEDWVAVGARGRYSNAAEVTTEKTGVAYVFKRTNNLWAQYGKVTDANGGPYHEFGASIGLSESSYENWLLVGAPGDAVMGGTDTTGKVCVYKLGYPTAPAGAVGVHAMWLQQDDLPVTGLAAGDLFGSGMYIYEDPDYDADVWWERAMIAAEGGSVNWPNGPKVYQYDHQLYEQPDAGFVFNRAGSPADPGPMGAYTGSVIPAFSRYGAFVGMNAYWGGPTNLLASSGAVKFYGPPEDLETDYQTVLEVDAPGVLANDFFLTFPLFGYRDMSAAIATEPANGDVTLNADGSFEYSPDAGFHGIDTFTYTCDTATMKSTAATVSIVVGDPESYTLTYTAGDHGSIQGDTEQTVFQGDDGTAVTAVPDANYYFVEWSDGVKTATRQDLDVEGDVSVSASFATDKTKVALSAPIGWMRPAVRRAYTYAGTMSPKGKPGKHEVKLVVQRQVGDVWKAYKTVTTITKKLSSTQTKYVVEFTFGKRGKYRLRGELSTATQFGRSSWTYLRTKH
jgi:hypothetical protein